MGLISQAVKYMMVGAVAGYMFPYITFPLLAFALFVEAREWDMKTLSIQAWQLLQRRPKPVQDVPQVPDIWQQPFGYEFEK